MATTTTEEQDTLSMGIRVTKEQRAELDKIAERQCNTVGGIIRLAINGLIAEHAEQVKASKKQRKG